MSVDSLDGHLLVVDSLCLEALKQMIDMATEADYPSSIGNIIML